MDYSVIDDAGITQEQFGALVGVSRVTVNTWVKGRFSPRASARYRVVKALALLRAAIAAGTLPVPPITHKSVVEDRLALLAKDLEPAEG